MRYHYRILGITVCLLCTQLGASVSRAQAQEAGYGLEVRRYDTVVLSGGRTIDGQIIEDNADFVEILNAKNIKQQFRRAEVTSVIRAVTPKEAHRNRMKQDSFSADDYEDQLAVGRWAAEYGDEIGELAIANLEVATRLRPSEREPVELLLPLLEQRDTSLLDDKDMDRELGIYLRALDAGVPLPELATRAATLFEKQRDFESAIVILKKLFAAGDPPAGIGERVAELLNRAGRRDEARTWVEDLLSSAPAESRDRLQAMHAGWLLEDVAVGNIEARTEFLAAVDELSDDSGSKHLLTGSYYLVIGDVERAKAPLGKAGQLGVFDAPAIVTYALVFAQGGDNKKARQTLENARKAVGVRLYLDLVRAYVLENEGDTAGALQLLQRTAENENASWQTQMVYLHALRRLSPTKAEASLDATVKPYLREFADNPVAFAEGALLLADEALRNGDGPTARRWFDYAGSAGHEGKEFYLGLAHAHLMEGGNPARARAALDAAHSLAPADIDVWNTLGYAEYRAGAFDRSLEYFDRVIASFPEEQRKDPNPPAQLAYARNGRYLVEAATGQELWSDSFDRAAGEKVLNNWVEAETYGIEVGLANGNAFFRGTQDYEDDGRTVIYREIPGERLARVRVTLAVPKGLAGGTVGLRLEDLSGASGLVFLRHPDGDLAFSVNGRSSSEVVRAPEEPVTPEEAESAEGSHPGAEYSMNERVIWPAGDSEMHSLEIRFEGDGGREVSLYFDNQRVAQGISVGFSTAGTIRTGVSFMAPKGTRCDVKIQLFEVFQSRVDDSRERKY